MAFSTWRSQERVSLAALHQKTISGQRKTLNYEPLGLLDVLPVQLPPDNDLRSLRVTLIALCLCGRRTPVPAVPKPNFFRLRVVGTRARYPITGWISLRASSTERRRMRSRSLCEISLHLHPRSDNQYNRIVLRWQDEGASWYYDVPYLGQNKGLDHE